MVTIKSLLQAQPSESYIVGLVYFSLLLDNMLLTVVVPIVPFELAQNDQSDLPESHLTNTTGMPSSNTSHSTFYDSLRRTVSKENENEEIGLLFASKAMIQLVVNPLVGKVINRVGCSVPLFTGPLCLFSSCLMFANEASFLVMFLARSVQGIGSACISIGGMALIADRHTEDKTRSKYMSIALGGIAAGVLIGYPFGSVFYYLGGKTLPLLIVASFLFIDLALLFILLRPSLEPDRILIDDNMYGVLADPYIILSAGAICVSTFAVAVLEPCLPVWIMEFMTPQKWQLDSFGYFVGTYLFGSIVFRLQRWWFSMVSLLTVGLCALIIPFCTRISLLVIPYFGLGLGIGFLDASLMPLLAFLVDLHHNAVYGTVYALAQAAVCFAYALGPLTASYLMEKVGFVGVMWMVGLLNLFYCPLCYFLRHVPTAVERSNEESVTCYKSINNSE